MTLNLKKASLSPTCGVCFVQICLAAPDSVKPVYTRYTGRFSGDGIVLRDRLVLRLTGIHDKPDNFATLLLLPV